MKNRKYRIDIEIYIVFLIVISITVFNAIYSSINISKNQEVTSQIVNVDIPTIQQLQNMNLLVTRSKMYTTNWVYLQSNKDDKDSLRKIHAIDYPLLKGDLSALMSQWKDKSNVDSMYVVFSEFGHLMSWEKKVMEQLKTFDDYEDPTKKFTAAEIIESEILPRSSKIITMLDHVISSKKEHAGKQDAVMASSYRSLLWSVSGIAIIIIIVVLIAAFYISDAMIVPLMRLKNFVAQMGKGEVPEIKLKVRRGAVGQMTLALKDLTHAMKQTADFAQEIGKGNFDVKFKPLSENDEFGNALLHMRDSLQKAEQETHFRNWANNGLARIGEVLRENTNDIQKLSDGLIYELVKIFEVNQGAVFLIRKNEQQEEYIELTGSYAFDSCAPESNPLKIGEGLIGQCIRNKETIYLKNAPNQYFNIRSGLGNAHASHVLIVPLRNNNIVYGAIELACFHEFNQDEIQFLEKIGDAMASSIASSIANSTTRMLLEETQKQAARLAVQEEELLKANEELSKQSTRLQASEYDLKQRNQDLKKTARLMMEKNDALEMAREALSIKAKELELNSRYKSEFLANMSHELRTPLNSVLILAKLLADNKNKLLSEKEIEYANVIHKSGNDLLLLINDILDLSKIEAGKLEMQFAETELSEINNDLESLFRELANDKKINFVIEFDNSLPGKIKTDKMRLEQIMKNLLSNAFKFTNKEAGIVKLSFSSAPHNIDFGKKCLLSSRQVIAITVSDNGIGIAPDKQQIIFEAFKQADGSTSRKFGGTGLGLSISRELASMLCGEIKVQSKEGEGSQFTLYIPVEGNSIIDKETCDPVELEATSIEHKTNEPVPAIVNQKVVSIYDYNKAIPEITIHKVLVVEDEPMQFEIIKNVIQQKEKATKCIHAHDALEAYSLLGEIKFDCIVLDLNLGNDSVSGYRLLEKIKSDEKLAAIPVIIYTGTEIDEEQEKILTTHAVAIVKKSIESPEKLVREVSLLLHMVKTNETNPLSPKPVMLKDKCVLLVDDNMRNTFALSSILEMQGAKVIVAGNGKEALDKLKSKKDIDIVLMDIMMPEMDGHTAMREIRKIEQYKELPIIALTAKAMPEDREKCIQSGATDYVAKPVNIDQLLSLMKIYLTIEV